MKIFINYRRDDSAGYAGRLFDHLKAHFGKNSVFMDIDTIEPGEDFRKEIQTAIGTCDVVLVMIGRHWLNIPDERGGRRLDDSRDWVRAEIASALANPRVRVIPVLVRNAPMPGEDQLPEDLKELPWRNAIELSDSRFQHDAAKLISVIERAVGKPAPGTAGGGQSRGTARRWGFILGFGGLGLIACLVGYRIFAPMLFGAPGPELTAEIPRTSPEQTLETFLSSPSAAPQEEPKAALIEPSTTLNSAPSPTLTEIPVTLTSTPDWYGVLNVRRPTEDEILAGIPPSIWDENNIEVTDIPSPGRKKYSGYAQLGREYLFTIYWCALSDNILRQNLSNLSTIFLVNDAVIPDRYITTYDYTTSNGWKCSYNSVVLSGWVAYQNYRVEGRRTIRTEINDGQTSYTPGEYIHELTIEAR